MSIQFNFSPIPLRAARKALKKLVSGGYVARHPTSGEMTYQMTQAGWMECRRMKDEAQREVRN